MALAGNPAIRLGKGGMLAADETLLSCRVDHGLPLAEVLHLHSDWLRKHRLLGPGKRVWAPITWSEWDLKVGNA